EGVAKAFGVPVVESATLAKMLRDHYQERCNEGHLRMALVPEGASLASTADVRWPTIRYANAWLMSGVPEIFRLKLPVAVAEIAKLTPASPFVSRAVYTRMDE